MVEHLYNSQQQKNDFVSFHRSVILVSFMTLFINLLAVLQSLTTMYKENDYVPNSTILGVLFFVFLLFCFTKDSILDYCLIMKTSVTESPLMHRAAQSMWCSDIYCACLYTFNVVSLFYFLSLPQCHCFLDIWPEYSTSLHSFVYFWQFAVCVHSEVIILKEWRDNEIKTMMIMFKK